MAPSRGGKGNQKKASSNAKPPRAAKPNEAHPRDAQEAPEQIHDATPVPLRLQQNILTAFTSVIPHILGATDSDDISSALPPILQHVKGHLYDRNFAAAFSRPSYLAAYAVRWSASRALGYVRIFDEVVSHLPKGNSFDGTGSVSPVRVAALGGGAGAELVALAGVYNLRRHHDHVPLPSSSPPAVSAAARGISITTFDVADWAPVQTTLAAALRSPPQLSAYASAAARAANAPLVDVDTPSAGSPFATAFHRLDLLSPAASGSSSSSSSSSSAELDAALEAADVVTLLFTLNELYTASPAATQAFLLDVTARVKTGALLLVVDSPGSYATVALRAAEKGAAAGAGPGRDAVAGPGAGAGASSDETQQGQDGDSSRGGGKRYPMRWLLEHTLFSAAPDALAARAAAASEKDRLWDKVYSTDSRWFRLPRDGLKHPVELEDMRAQVHLYRRL